MQGLSGLGDFLFTIIADVTVFFTYCGPMLNEIRSVYKCSSNSMEVFGPIIKGCKRELLADTILDMI